jgi:hypothetical protein
MSLNNTANQLNDIGEIVDNRSFESLLEKAGSFPIGHILVNVVPMLRDQDGGKYFIPKFKIK